MEYEEYKDKLKEVVELGNNFSEKLAAFGALSHENPELDQKASEDPEANALVDEMTESLNKIFEL